MNTNKIIKLIIKNKNKMIIFRKNNKKHKKIKKN
jgi:hypothetical protein